MNNTRPDLAVNEAAALCGVHHRTIRNWIKDGRLRAYRQAGHGIRIRPADLARLRRPILTCPADAPDNAAKSA